MNRVDYVNLFSIPEEYQPPDLSEISTNTEYPNLNSDDYRQRNAERPNKMQPFFECFDINEDGNIIIGTNDIRGRAWDGSIWSYSSIDEFGDNSKTCYKLYCDAPITNIKYIKKDIFFLTKANGCVQLWSAKTGGKYCLFLLSAKTEHVGIITAMDVLDTDSTKIVTVTSDACIKVWEVNEDQLESLHTIRNAHSDYITGVSASPSSEPLFSTCSRDKSALMWDYREQRPATALFEDHKHAFTSINWADTVEDRNEVFLGDETGVVYVVDPRQPNSFVDQLSIFPRPIRKIALNMDKLAIIGNTNMVKVFRHEENDYKLVYKDAEATNLLRDIQWDTWDENAFFTVGWDSKLNKHAIN